MLQLTSSPTVASPHNRTDQIKPRQKSNVTPLVVLVGLLNPAKPIAHKQVH